MFKKVKAILGALFPYILIVIVGIAGTQFYKAGDGIRGSPFVNQPGNISLFDEGGQLEMAQRVLNGQVPYRDFWTLYTPLRLYFLAGFMKVLGESILTERIYFALVPLFGFIFFFQLVKLFTKNSAVAFLTTLLVIAGHTINERNTLFIITIFLFAKAVPFWQEKNTAEKNFFSYKFALFTGISSALTFLLSQEFGLYSFAGVVVFLAVFCLLNRISIVNFFRFLFFYALGTAVVTLLFFFSLFINNAWRDFVQNTMLDFASGPIARLWAEPLPNFLLPDFSGLFWKNSITYSLPFLSYISIFFFLCQILFSLYFLLRTNTDKPRWWAMLFIALFGLINSRGLFFTLKDSRFFDVLTFVLVGIILIDLQAVAFLRQYKNVGGVFLTFFLILINWYAATLISFREFFNDFSEMITFSRSPAGVYFDNPAAKVYLTDPYYLETLREANLSITQNTANLLQYTNFFPTSNWHQKAERIDKQLKQTFNQVKFTPQKMSDITSDDAVLQNKFNLWKNNFATISAELKLLHSDIQTQENLVADKEKKALKQNVTDDQVWFKWQKQLILMRSIYVYIDKLSETISKVAFYLPEKPSQSVYQQQFSYLEEIPSFLSQSPGKYSFGLPAASLYLFLAHKINPTRFTAIQTNITLKDQKIALQALEKTKPCRAIRQKIGVQYLDVTEYAPLLWQYLETNYRVVKNIGSVELMVRKSCI